MRGSREALGHGVVVGIANRAHRGAQAGFSAAGAEGESGVLTSLIGMVDDGARFTRADRHLQGVEDELGSQVVRHRPTHNPPAPGIEDDGGIEEAGGGLGT